MPQTLDLEFYFWNMRVEGRVEKDYAVDGPYWKFESAQVFNDDLEVPDYILSDTAWDRIERYLIRMAENESE